MPEPRQDEKKEQFITRCIRDKESINTFPDSKQRAAFCFSQWDRFKKK